MSVFFAAAFAVPIILFSRTARPAGNGRRLGDVVAFRYAEHGGMTRDFGFSYAVRRENGSEILRVKPDGEPAENTLTVHPQEPLLPKLTEVAEKYRLARWNGFNKRCRNAVDGKSYTLEIVTADGGGVLAQGYMAYPRGYSAAVGEIKKIFSQAYAQAAKK